MAQASSDQKGADFADGVSVLVPAFNEERAVAETVERLLTVLRAMEVEFEIIVVDDGSTDRTAERAESAGATVVRLPRNTGYGAALMQGARRARHGVLVLTDADGTYPVERIPDLVSALGEAEMAIGARTGAEVAIPAIRKPAKWFITQLAQYLTGHRIPDLNSGLRAVRRNLWDRYERYFPTGFSLTSTITLAALVNGHHVEFLPIDYHARIGRSKIRPIRDTIGFVQLILRTVLYFEPLKVFVPASLLMFLLGAGVGLLTWGLQELFGVGRFMDVTTVVLILTAVQLLAIGGLADLISKRLP